MYDLIIIGAGPAGLTAAIYAARYKLNTLVLAKDVGGVANEAHKIENWPGTKEVSGIELMQNFQEQVENLNIEIKEEEVVDIKDNFNITTNKNNYQTESVILALGTRRIKLNVKGEEEFLGKGVSYCATCEAASYRNKTVAVIGNTNEAAQAALLLTQFAKKTMIITKEELEADPILIKQIEDKKIKIIKGDVKEVKGTKFIEEIILDNRKTLKLEGIFIEIGSTPSFALAKNINLKLKNNYIITDSDQRTNIKKAYAAGDITLSSMKQIITAAAQGAIAAQSAYQDIKNG